MDRFFHLVTAHKKRVIIIFIILTVVCVMVFPLVSVNYNLVNYLPKDAQSTMAITIMEDEFTNEMPNARVMISHVSVTEALQYKAKLAAIDGISSVTWLDDVVGADTLGATPVEFLDTDITENYYKDESALISITIEGGKEESAMRAAYDLIGDDNAAAGQAVNMAALQGMSTTEILGAIAILLPIIIIILTLITTSWIEPLLFLLSIGVAVLINMGTNIFFGEVSFVTQTVSPVLQLAVSLDYAIFLLHSFNDLRTQYEPHEAMKRAMKQALATVSASAATTVIGFSALIFMRFGIGADLGLILVKGVLLSFISVMVFLPALTLVSYKLIDKTKHRQIVPELKKAGKWILKIRIPFLILVVLILVPCFLAQSANEFKYGVSSITKAGRAGDDAAKIEETFGKENLLVLLVPGGDTGEESALCDALQEIPHITGCGGLCDGGGCRDTGRVCARRSGGTVLFGTLRPDYSVYRLRRRKRGGVCYGTERPGNGRTI